MKDYGRFLDRAHAVAGMSNADLVERLMGAV
jgi:hypothetical protein